MGNMESKKNQRKQKKIQKEKMQRIQQISQHIFDEFVGKIIQMYVYLLRIFV